MSDDSRNQTYLIMAGHHESRGEIEKAIEFYEKSIATSPSAKVHERLGIIFKERDDIARAEEHFRSALKLDDESLVAIYNLAIIDRLEGRYESAMKRYDSLKDMGIDDAGVDMSVGVLLSETGHPERAIEFYENAFRKNPKNNLVRFNLSLCLMTLGDFDRGLRLYEDRIWHAHPPGEEWMGEGGCGLMVVPEQGNGDIIQFSRYLPMLKPLCKKVTLLCNKPLVRLMQGVEGVDEVVEFNPGDEFVEVESSSEESTSFERFSRIMSLPLRLGIDPSKESFRKNIHADPLKVAEWRATMGDGAFKVGLCWQGGRRNKPDMVAIDSRRSISFNDMSPLLAVEGVEFYSLQKDDEQHKDHPAVLDLMDQSSDFFDTAALIENLDLVVTVDTAVAHLAASLGKPTWMLSRRGGCWRWGSEGESTFWYPSMRIFRQQDMNDWDPVIKTVADELRALAK